MDEETSSHRLILDASSSAKQSNAVAGKSHSSFSGFVEKGFVGNIGHKPCIFRFLVLFRTPLDAQSRKKLRRYPGLSWSRRDS